MFRSFRPPEVREEDIYVFTDDRRCVKTSLARLLSDFPALAAAPTPSNRASLDLNFRHFISALALKLSSLL